MTAMATKLPELTAEEVREFLKSHPDFFKNNLDVVAELTPPERDLGNGILDFQHYMLKNLQQDSKELKSRYDLLVDFCRDNMSVQMQVHHAVMRLIRARSLEQLLEALTLDLVNLFNVDVVRMALESEVQHDTSYGEQAYSGIVFIEPGTVDAALGKRKNVLLVEDCGTKAPPGFDAIFADCADMIRSCALLRLQMETVDRNIILAFGVRHKDRFHPGQGIELLHFLAQVVAHQLDSYLKDLAI
ncbi:MAG: DUF484 family protein [Pseudomonadota bacterium]|nr:DUF484 family protein [Pseudomonadota bacterium]